MRRVMVFASGLAGHLSLGELRQRHLQLEGDRYGGVYCVAAAFQDFDASLGAEGFVSGDHGVRTAHRLLRPGV